MECIINDLVIYYEEYGSGKPILCLHGFTEDHNSMKGCLEPFFKNLSGYRRIYLDMPGMGKTVAKDWVKNADTMLEVLKKFVDEVICDKSFLLVGTSYGGYRALGMAMAMNMKIDGMFLFGPCTVTDYEKRKLPNNFERFVEKGLEESIDKEEFEDFKNFLGESVVATKETWNRYKNEILPAYKIADTNFCKKYRENGYSFSFESKLNNLQFNNPVTVITGRQDSSIGYEDSWDILKHLPKFTFVALDGVGHMMQIETPMVLNVHLHDWIMMCGE